MTSLSDATIIMTCKCTICVQLLNPNLADLPPHPFECELILALCRLGLATTDHYFTFSSPASDFGMPETDHLYGDEPDVFRATIRGFCHEAGCELLIVESRPATFRFRWNPEDARRITRTILTIAYRWSAKLDNSNVDLVECDRKQRERLASLQGPSLNETVVMQRLMLDQPILLPGFPFLRSVEWDVTPGQMYMGRGDLVLASRTGVFVVVEVKYLDFDTKGQTARLNRSKKRRKVREQAKRYREHFARKYPEAVAVLACICMNRRDGGVEILTLEDGDRAMMEAVRTVEWEMEYMRAAPVPIPTKQLLPTVEIKSQHVRGTSVFGVTHLTVGATHCQPGTPPVPMALTSTVHTETIQEEERQPIQTITTSKDTWYKAIAGSHEQPMTKEGISIDSIIVYAGIMWTVLWMHFGLVTMGFLARIHRFFYFIMGATPKPAGGRFEITWVILWWFFGAVTGAMCIVIPMCTYKLIRLMGLKSKLDMLIHMTVNIIVTVN
ncbi:hypothetical protein BC938DRAFT_475218 [Jimgerdemannia flammicorona]|uniref:Uncharacterized protein n=1 Tax=Jimgerdemannia flammicorona TaxID=994334 RepID=A0A433QRY2_9FUNG|nr:hypothetical protein BC938DRAFT_475218 [Jimgerdemannia flammicorona]